jgi:hypothetical protein
MGKFFKELRPSELGTTAYVQASGVVGQRGAWSKLLDISVNDSDAEPLIVSLRAEYAIVNGVQRTGYPLVCYLLWGIGGAKNEVEFDLAVGRLPTQLVLEGAVNGTNDLQPMINYGNGVQVHISASHVSLYVRNDGAVSPLTAPGGDWIGDQTGIAKVQAFIAPGDTTRQNTLERTIWLAGGMENP